MFLGSTWCLDVPDLGCAWFYIHVYGRNVMYLGAFSGALIFFLVLRYTAFLPHLHSDVEVVLKQSAWVAQAGLKLFLCVWSSGLQHLPSDMGIPINLLGNSEESEVLAGSQILVFMCDSSCLQSCFQEAPKRSKERRNTHSDQIEIEVSLLKK